MHLILLNWQNRAKPKASAEAGAKEQVITKGAGQSQRPLWGWSKPGTSMGADPSQQTPHAEAEASNISVKPGLSQQPQQKQAQANDLPGIRSKRPPGLDNNP